MVSLDDARAHCKADGDDDGLLQKYLDAANRVVSDFCNRAFFPDEEALSAAQALTTTATRVAYDAYYDALEDAEDAEDAEEDGTEAALSTGHSLRTKAKTRLDHTLARIARIDMGQVVTPAVDSAVLMITGKLYEARADYMEVPRGAREMLQPYVWIGGPQS